MPLPRALLIGVFLAGVGARHILFAQVEPPLPARIAIDARKTENTISPLLYGQFIEFMYEGIKGGLHAELIRDRGFEAPPNSLGLPRYWERYPDDRNDDYGLAFLWDASEFYPPRKDSTTNTVGHALRVKLSDGVIQRHGLYQGRVPIRSGVNYLGYLWLKGSNFRGTIRVALEQDITEGDVYDETMPATTVMGGGWQRCSFLLRPVKSDPLARFVILFEGRGLLWIDQVSLIPGDAVADTRADVFEKIDALRPAFMRWPGGNVAQDYHWMWGVGPRDGRITWPNLSWNNEPEPSDFGTDEYIRFCRRLRAEPTITVNVEGLGATAQEAAAWVEYCNGSRQTTQGTLRADNGHPNPHGVRLWEVGNEIWGDWVRGHSDATTYASNLLRYAAAMRAVDKNIQLIAVGDNDTNWNNTVLRLAGSQIDYLSIHHYYMENEMDGDPRNLMARPLHYERFYGEMRRWVRELVPQRRITLAINEWGLGLPTDRAHSIEAALYAARLMNVFERNSDFIAMTAVSDLVNGWPGGIIQASRHGLFVTPIYLVNQLYREHQGAERLAVTVQSPTFNTTREGKNVPYLDVVASRNTNGSELFLKAVNVHPTQALDVEVQMDRQQLGPEGELSLITANAGIYNSFRTPNIISIRRSKIPVNSRFQLNLPKESIAVLRIKTL
jgi:alpha-L-arabinofuranosidase